MSQKKFSSQTKGTVALLVLEAKIEMIKESSQHKNGSRKALSGLSPLFVPKSMRYLFAAGLFILAGHRNIILIVPKQT